MARAKERMERIDTNLLPDLLRLVNQARDKGASSCLNAAPLVDQDLVLQFVLNIYIIISSKIVLIRCIPAVQFFIPYLPIKRRKTSENISMKRNVVHRLPSRRKYTNHSINVSQGTNHTLLIARKPQCSLNTQG